MRRLQPETRAETEKTTANPAGKPVCGNVCTPFCVRLTILVYADGGVAPGVGLGAGVGVWLFCPKTEGAGEGDTFTALFEDNLPVSKKYPTAKAAKTSPIVINFSHLGSSMAEIYQKDQSYATSLCRNFTDSFTLFKVSSSPKILMLSKRGGVTVCPETATLIS